jgi:hypothetical protein
MSGIRQRSRKNITVPKSPTPAASTEKPAMAAPKSRATPRVPGEQTAAPAPAASTDTAAAKAVAAPVSQGNELPDQDDIDRTKITRPVLSKQGWVLPIDRPGPQFAKG